MPRGRQRRTSYADTERGPSVRCSFCSKTADQVEHVIAGPDVWICSECVAVCVGILAENRDGPDDRIPAP